VNSRALLALTASALALPGLSTQVKADAAPTTSTVAYRVSSYEEDALDRGVLAAGSAERYDITIHQLRLLLPVGENYSLTLNSSYESMSGASPWYTLSRANGSAAVAMSGATISEQRRDFSVAGRRYLENGTVGLSLAASHENDYDSLSGSVDVERHFNDNLTTLATGLGFSDDALDPTQDPRYIRILDEDKRSQSAFISLSQIINRDSVLQTGLSLTHLSGYLSDPYKLNDRRPDSRTQWAWTTSWRQYLSGPDAALHADYRFYHDNFGIDSHTLDLAWHQNLGARLQVVPGLRYYSQSAADFFRPTLDFSGTRPFQATDFRLSAYGAWSASLKVQVDIEDFVLSLSAERYRADDAYGTYDGPASPALVAFNRVSLGVEYRF
jgi:hypothetical protein